MGLTLTSPDITGSRRGPRPLPRILDPTARAWRLSINILVRSFLSLLEKQTRELPIKKTYWPNLLRVCQQIHLPLTATWFARELHLIATDQTAATLKWDSVASTREILFAAVRQCPAARYADALPDWERLLRVRQYSSIGLIGISSNVSDQLQHLSIWWTVSPPESRRSEELKAAYMEGITHARSQRLD